MKALIALIVLFALGVGAWFYFSTASVDTPGFDPFTAPDVTTASRGDDLDAKPLARDETSKPERSAADPVQAPTDARIDGAARITFRLLARNNGQEAALAAARVRLLRFVPKAQKDKSPPEQTEAVTDAAGQGVVAALEDGSYALLVDHADVPRDWRSVTFAVKDGADVDLGSIVIDVAAGLRGRVVDQRGAPVAGAAVTLNSASFFGLAEDVDSNEASLTDAQGRFELTRQSSGERALVIDSVRHRRFVVAQTLRSGQYIDLGDLRLEGGRRLSGVVVDDSGKPVVGARVTPRETTSLSGQASTYFAKRRSVVAAAGGAFEIDGLPEEVRLMASAKGYASVEHDVADDASSVTLVLAPKGAVSGGVVAMGARGSEAVAAARVLALMEGGAWQVHEASCDEDGRFEFASLPAGRYRFAADKPGQGFGEVTGVDIPARGRTGIEIRMTLGPTLSVDVVDANGKPVEGAEVKAWHVPNPPVNSLPVERTAKTNATGRADFKGMWLQATRVQVEHRGYVDANLEIAPLARDQVHQVVLRRGGRIVGRVVDERGEPVGLVNVHAKQRTPGADEDSMTVSFGFDDSAKSAADGSFDIGPLAPGTYNVGALRPRMRKGSNFSFELPQKTSDSDVAVTVQEGQDSKVVVTLPRPGSIGGMVRYRGLPLAGARVFARPNGTAEDEIKLLGIDETVTDDQGKYSFEGLASATWTLVCKPPRASIATAERTVRVQGATENKHDIEVQGGAVEGRVVEPGKIGHAVEGLTAIVNPRELEKTRKAMVSVAFGVVDGSGLENSVVFQDPSLPEALPVEKDGSFRIDFIPEGTWRLAIRKGNETLHEREIQIRDGVLLQLGEVRLEASFPVNFKIHDKAGLEVVDGTIALYREGELATGGKAVATAIVKKGSARIDALTPGRYDLELRDATNNGPAASQVGTFVLNPDGSTSGSELRLR